MKKFQILASTYPTAEAVHAHCESDKRLDRLCTSRPVWVEADSLEAATDLFIETAVYKNYATKNPTHHFYYNDGNWNLVQYQ